MMNASSVLICFSGAMLACSLFTESYEGAVTLVIGSCVYAAMAISCRRLIDGD